jgi:intein/homing endonuclease
LRAESLTYTFKTNKYVENKFAVLQSIEKIENVQQTYTIELKTGDNFIANGLLVKTEKLK